MDPSEEIEIPEIIPVMTLQGTVLFPHAVMPLFIFEDRYRQMLKDILNSHRLFAIFNENPEGPEEGHEEQPARMGTVGVVRAAHQNPDGTSNLALQGIIRVRLREIVQESPYRMVRVETCPDVGEAELAGTSLREHILSILEGQPKLTAELPDEYVSFIHSISEPAPFIDVAIHSLCHCPKVKQALLETRFLPDRYEGFEEFLQRERRRLDLFQELQGRTRDNEIDLN